MNNNVSFWRVPVTGIIVLGQFFFQRVETLIHFHLYFLNSLIIHKENTKEIND